MKKIIAIIIIASASLHANASKWEVVTKSNKSGSSFDYKADSIDIEEASSTPVAKAIFRVVETGGTTAFYSLQISHSTCLAGYGSLMTFMLNGKLFSQIDFVFGGGNVSSTVGEFICVKAWQRALANVINTQDKIDYENNSKARINYDRILELVKIDPSNKARSIDWMVNEAHRKLLIEVQKSTN